MHGSLKTTSVLVFLLACFSGCAATPEASLHDDAAAKKFDSAPRAAIVYLYRADTPGGSATPAIWIDDRIVGQSLPATYFRVAVRPGRNRIAAFAPDHGRFEIDTREGGVFFVAMQAGGNEDTAGNTIFHSVPPEAGKAEILRCCTMIETWRPGQSRMPF